MMYAMNDAAHREAMEKVDAAQTALASGRTKRARDHFSEAADLEERRADGTSSDRILAP